MRRKKRHHGAQAQDPGAAHAHGAETCRDASAQPLHYRSKRQSDGSPVQGPALLIPVQGSLAPSLTQAMM